jgi:hypothetical protein
MSPCKEKRCPGNISLKMVNEQREAVAPIMLEPEFVVVPSKPIYVWSEEGLNYVILAIHLTITFCPFSSKKYGPIHQIQ